MRKLRRFVALLITIATLASLCSFSMTAYAEEETSAVEVTAEDLLLIEKLEAMGLIKNEYEPTEYVTREQMANIIAYYMAMAGGSSAAQSPFRDVSVKDASFPIINALYEMGIITGDDQFKFHPDNYITYNEVMVFVVNAIGYKPFAVREGGYPTGYHRVAIRHNMFKNLSIQDGKAYATLADIYRMMEAAMSAATIIPSYTGNDVRYTFSDTETFLSEMHNIKKYRGLITGNEYTGLTTTRTKLTDEQIEIDGKIYDTPGYYYDYFLGYTVDYYVRTAAGYTELVYIEETPRENSVMRIDAEDLLNAKATNERIYYEDEEYDEEYIELVEAVDVIYNNQSYSGFGLLKNILPVAGYIEALDNNGDNVYDVLFINEYQNIVVESVDYYNETITAKYWDTVLDVEATGTFDLDSTDNKVKIVTDKGTPVELSYVKKGDVLSIAFSKAPSNKVITAAIAGEGIVGTIQGYNTEDGYDINGQDYKAAHDYIASTSLDVGLSGVFYLDMNGRIVLYEYDSEGDNSTIAVMTGLEYKIGNLGTEVKVRLFTKDGVFFELPLAERVKIDGTRYDITDATEATAALVEISGNNIVNAKYTVGDTYVVRYNTNSRNEVSYIDKGGITGKGHLNIVTNDDTLLNRNNILQWSEADVSKYAALNTSTGVIFAVPSASDINELDQYSIYTKSLRAERYYGPVTESNASFTTNADNFTAYTFEQSDVNTFDVILFRGLVDQDGGGDGRIKVITEKTIAANEDGLPVHKIYQGSSAIGSLASQVTVTKLKADGSGTENITYSDLDLDTDNDIEDLFTGLTPVLRPGVAVKCGFNNKGLISSIKLLAEYKQEIDGSYTLYPTFKSATAYVNSTPSSQANTNYAVGTVDEADASKKLVQFTGGTNTYVMQTGSASVVIYRAEDEKVTIGTISDLQKGDQIAIRTSAYYSIKDIIIFR